MSLLSVADAAVELGVSARRVRQLLASGEMDGQQVGRSWVIDGAAIDRMRPKRAGRPWSAASAWAVLELAAGGDPEHSPVERSRARKRLAESGLAGLLDRYALEPNADRPNLIVRAVDDDVWPFDEDANVAPWSVVAVDLLDANDERSRRAGLELIERSQ